MAVHRQRPDSRQDSDRWYSYCPCGVCGPIRTDPAAAARDDRAHLAVCSARKVAA